MLPSERNHIRTIKFLYAAVLITILLLLITAIVAKEIFFIKKPDTNNFDPLWLQIICGILTIVAIIFCKKIFYPIQKSVLSHTELSPILYINKMKRILLLVEVISFTNLVAYLFTGNFSFLAYVAVLLGYLLYLLTILRKLK